MASPAWLLMLILMTSLTLRGSSAGGVKAKIGKGLEKGFELVLDNLELPTDLLTYIPVVGPIVATIMKPIIQKMGADPYLKLNQNMAIIQSQLKDLQDSKDVQRAKATNRIIHSYCLGKI